MKYLAILIILLLKSSCKKEDAQEAIEVKETIIFDVGFNPNFNFVGTFFDKISHEEVIYFAEPVTNKQIKFFNIKGKLLDSINLENLSKMMPTINSLKVISRDTLLFFNYGEIVVVNKKGAVLKKIDLNKVISKDSSNDVFEISNDFGSNKDCNGQNIILGINWSSNKIDNKKLSYKDFFIKNFNKPSIIRLDNYLTDSITYKFSLQNHYKSWYKEPKIFSEGFNYRQINGQLFIFSFFSNDILVFDIEKLKVIEKVCVKSNETSIGIKPLGVNETEFSGENVIKKAKAAGAITDIFYLANKHQYYIIVRHEVDEDNVGNEKDRPFSIIKYDELFNIVDEIIMTNKNVEFFDYYRVIETKNGFMKLNKKHTNEKSLSFSFIE